jgi:hypothetical protein
MPAPRKWVISVDDVPPDRAIHMVIYERTDFFAQVRKFKDYPVLDYYKLPVSFDLTGLRSDVLAALDKFGVFPFSYPDRTPSAAYLSTSLTHNPAAADKVAEDPHRATLGSTRFLKHGPHAESLEEHSEKDSYNDTLGFRHRTPIATYGKIGKLLDTYHRPIIRSRISVIKAGMPETMSRKFGWHNDEQVFLNLRMSFPLVSSANYGIQLITAQGPDGIRMADFSLEPGHCYSYDTYKPHRAYCRSLDPEDRVNLIVGVCPWFDFDPEENRWYSNEHYGETHPFELLRSGLISSAIKG